MPIAPLAPDVQSAPLGLPENRAAAPDTSAITQAGQNVSKELGATLQQTLDDQTQKANVATVLAADNQLSDYLTKQQFGDPGDPANGVAPTVGFAATKGKDAIGIAPGYINSADKQIQDIAASLPSDTARDSFLAHASVRRNAFQTDILQHSLQQGDAYMASEATARVANSANFAALNYNDDSRVDYAVQNATNTAKSVGIAQGQSQAQIDDNATKAASSTITASIKPLIDTNPQAAQARFDKYRGQLTAEDAGSLTGALKVSNVRYQAASAANAALGAQGAPQTSDGIISYVIDKNEGTTLTTDGNGRSIYGVNEKNQPGLFAGGTLPSRDDATKYYQDLWQSSGAANVPSNMQLSYFDTVVNMGKPRADKLLAQSNGDPQAFADARAADYRSIAAADPAKAKFLNGWLKRTANVAAASTQQAANAIPDLGAAYQHIDNTVSDPEVAQAAKTNVKTEVDGLQAAQEQRYKDASARVWTAYQAGQVPSATDVAAMKPEDQVALQNNPNTTNQQVYTAARGNILAGQPVDVDAIRWQLGPKYAELKDLQSDPSKLAGARTAQSVIDSAAFAVIQKKAPTTADEAAKMDAFRQAVEVQTDAIAKANGRPPTTDEVQKVVDRLSLNLKFKQPGDWTAGTIPVYQAKPGSTIIVPGIPDRGISASTGRTGTAAFAYNGKTYDKAGIINEIVADMQNRRIPLSSDAISQRYANAVKAGIISPIFAGN